MSVTRKRWPMIRTPRNMPPMPAQPPSTPDTSWPMAPDIIDLFPTIRAHVARTIAALEQQKGSAHEG